MIDLSAYTNINTNTNTNNIYRSYDFMGLAYEMALQAACLDEVPVGAVLTKYIDGQEKLVAMAHNQTLIQQQIATHAEMLALKQASEQLHNYRLNDCRLYITLEPCLMCAGAMINARVAEVYYLVADTKTGVAHSNLEVFNASFNHHTQVYIYQNDVNHIKIQEDIEKLRLAYLELLQTFFRNKRNAKKTNKG